MNNEYDLVVLGGGTGGYVAAIRASQLGLKTAIVENRALGGTCLHRGCIPSKTLLKSAEKWRDLQNISQFGLKAGTIDFDFTKIQQRKTNIVDRLHQGVSSLLQQADIDIYHGYGRILGPSIFSPVSGTISIAYENEEEDNTILVPKNVLIATGSVPRALPGLPFDETSILSSEEALQMEQLPTSIAIIGGGVIGIEWASMLIDYGVEVTVIEQASSILPNEDESVRKEMQKQLTKRGVIFKTNRSVTPQKIHSKGQYQTLLIGEEELTVEKVLVSIGRTGNVGDIGLNNTDIAVDQGFIQTNEVYQTDETHIYAIGDCIGGMQLAHAASKEGTIAVEHMAGNNPRPIGEKMIPSCIYSFPEAAKIGLTEEAAKQKGFSLNIGKIPFQALGKSHVNGETKGFMKVITDAETEDILGIHLLGDHATELIGEASLATMLDASAWEISQVIHPHPTLSEVFGEAAQSVDRKQIHG